MSASNNAYVDIDCLKEFQEVFITFLEGMAHENRQSIRLLKQSLSMRFQDYKKEFGKKEDEKLKVDELKQLIETDLDLQDEFDELAYYLSLFVRALEIFRQFSQIFIIRHLLEWSMIIRDKDLLNNLASVVFTKIFSIQVRMIEILRLGTADNIPDPIEREVHEIKFFDLTKALVRSMGGWRDLDEISQFYQNAYLKKEVKPVMDSLSKIRKNFQIIQHDSDPLDELPISNPLNWNARTVYEFNNPDKYSKGIVEEGFDEDEVNDDE